jgi:hypothetical protein
MNVDRQQRKKFVVAYLQCALWSSTAYGVPEDTQDGDFDTSFESYGFDLDAIDPKAKRAAMKDCLDFIHSHDTLLLDSGGSTEQHGSDFWLTRNGHGAGFWDRGYGRVGTQLSDAAKTYGSVDLYLGDDNHIHGF